MKHLALALLCACLASPAWAGSKKPRTRVVDGETVIAGPAFKAVPVVVVAGLRFFDCHMADTGAPCTVITGTAVSNVGCGEAIMVVNIHMWLTRQGPKPVSSDLHACLTPRGKATARIVRPATGRPIAFTIIGPPRYPVGNEAEHVAHDWKPSYTVTYSFEQVPRP